YARADYSSSASFGNVFSNWFITPTLDVTTGDTFSFYTRTISNSAYPSRLQVRLSTNGTSNNVGADWTTVGDFTTLLTEINPLEQPGVYPETWTQYTLSFSSTFTGRIGFRYYVVDTNNNGDYIGLDTFSTTASLNNPVPEPSTYLLTLSGMAMIAIRGRMKARKIRQS
ncbi:MAG: choice-of-anchor J domain-containing protein, partial [bacterium]